MFLHPTVNLHLPMIISGARDLIKKSRRAGGMGDLDFGSGSSLVGSQDDWWQRYVYDSTQGALRVLGARYGEGNYYPVDDPRYRQQPAPTIVTTPGMRPQKEESFKLTTNQAMLIAGGILLFLVGKNKR
jgi:hypothetical protein